VLVTSVDTCAAAHFDSNHVYINLNVEQQQEVVLLNNIPQCTRYGTALKSSVYRNSLLHAHFVYLLSHCEAVISEPLP
jgi:hypothetical protein